jgi:prolycopene isomerase
MRGVHRESKKEVYDVVVIGAGIGGLSVAALLAKAGKSVLLVERHDRPGGYAHGFKRRGFHFDSGVHLVSGCSLKGYRNGSAIHKICKAVGIHSQAVFIPIPAYARAVYPEFEISLQAGEEAFITGLTERFPQEKNRLLDLTRLCRVLAEEAMLAEEILEQGKSARVSPALVLANLFRYRRTTLTEALDEFLVDAQLKSACASLWPYLGLPPSKLSFLYWASMIAGYTYEGGYYCHGSFQTYANLLAAAVEEQGGEVLLNSSVRRICVEQDKISGIILENGQVIRAETVVSNIDARQTADLLIGREHLPQGYCEGLEKLTASLSVFVSYVATDLQFAEQAHTHESFFFDSFDHESNYALTLKGHSNWFSATIPTLADPSLAPQDQNIVLLTTLCPFEIGQSWRLAKRGFQQDLLEKAERHFPGLNDHLLFVESGSPRTLERYTLNQQGAAYGFAPTPDQIGPNRPSVRGALHGLYHTGHWTRPGGGVAGVSVSALLATQAILDIPKQEDFWKFLGLNI